MTNGNIFCSSVIDFTSPFYLTNNDNPKKILVSHILEDLALVSQGSSIISAYYTKLKSLWESMRLIIQFEARSFLWTLFLMSIELFLFFFKKKNKTKGHRKQRPKCDHCGWVGHTIDTCYVLHGYPPSHRLHQSSKETSSKPTINAKNTIAANSNQSSPQFTQDQYRRLLSMVTEGNAQPMVNFAGNSTSSPSSIPLHTWIVDTCASDHMIFDTSLFHSSTPVSQIAHVKLPNGSFSSVTHIGSVFLTHTLCLHQVLCVPSFGFNLLSISNLTAFFSCLVTFLMIYAFFRTGIKR
ncbi:hypothetical protein AMTRI_Chr03g51390 [Amborella trichopoda]